MIFDPLKHYGPFDYAQDRHFGYILTMHKSHAQHRRSIRLKGYNYIQPGWYFITLCTKNREQLFCRAGVVSSLKVRRPLPIGILCRGCWNLATPASCCTTRKSDGSNQQYKGASTGHFECLHVRHFVGPLLRKPVTAVPCVLSVHLCDIPITKGP